MGQTQLSLRGPIAITVCLLLGLDLGAAGTDTGTTSLVLHAR